VCTKGGEGARLGVGIFGEEAGGDVGDAARDMDVRRLQPHPHALHVCVCVCARARARGETGETRRSGSIA
jgi:hypothetical protein